MLSNRRRFLQGAASAKVAPVTLQDRSYEPLKLPRPISLAALTILAVSPANQVLCAAKAGYSHGGIRLVLRPFAELTLHGAGDVFTSALCGELLCGKAPMDALDSAADFCDRCIHETVKRQPWHWYGLAFEPVLKGNHV